MMYKQLIINFTVLALVYACSAADSAELTKSSHQGLTASESKSGWQLLFDGKSTTGWRNFRKPGISDGWMVRDGVLHREKRGAGDIITVDQYDRFELSLEYRIATGGNSGIMFHVTEQENAPWMTGPEVQILDNVAGHDPQKAGWLYQLYVPKHPNWVWNLEQKAGVGGDRVADATRPAGQWNHIYLRVSPQQSEVALNGVSYYRFQKGSKDWDRRVAASKFSRFAKFGSAARGHICLQDHGDAIAFRNIKVRKLAEDGSVANPVDGPVQVRRTNPFPEMKWDGWDSIDEEGRVGTLRPIALTHAGDGTGGLFIATQSGMIHMIASQPAVSRTKLVLDLRGKVADWRKSNEEGLLGLAFHPDFKQNRQFFVYYSSPTPERASILARYQMPSGDAEQPIDPDSAEIIMTVPQPFLNHNGGSIAFGPDGYLYISLGDGGSRNDPMENGQNLNTLLGSILRIDVDNKQGDLGYAIPKDNPFLDRAGARGEIYAYGLRNVWGLTFDRKTGALWAADVGQDLWEEVDIIQRGGNYGWNLREGTHAFGNSRVQAADPIREPVWEYDHRIGKSITGGYVYRGQRIPELQESYIYGDYVSGKIWALKYDYERARVVSNRSIVSSGGLPVVAFGQDEAGELYYLVESSGSRGIFRLEPQTDGDAKK